MAHPVSRPGLLVAASLAVLLALQGCGTIRLAAPLPKDLENEVRMPGFPGVRAWGDMPSEDLTKSAVESMRQELAANNGVIPPDAAALALSGGGGDGAFGAGLLCGWSEAGDRPSFKMVTGISTGALIAPMAFLGPAYDERLRKAYTEVSDIDIYQPLGAFRVLLSLANIAPVPSMADTRPLERQIAQLVDEQALAEIGREHMKGRRLLVGTTQMDAERLVIWNMGAIAASGHPGALELFRRIMLASASMPAMFPPQYFTVEAGGKTFEEMHVDGGVKVEVMLYEDAIRPFSVAGRRTRDLYIIRNQSVTPDYKVVQPQLKYIAGRAIDTLTKSQGVGDLYRLYVYAQRDMGSYNLAYIPADFDMEAATPFDKAYMNALFQRGYEMARTGYPWAKYPPGFDPTPGRIQMPASRAP